MPSLTRNEPIRHLLVLMAILLCLIGLAILQTLENSPPLPPPPKKRKKKIFRRHKKKTGKTKALKTTGQKASHLTDLPIELLMLIFQHLAPDEVQPCLDVTSFHAHAQAQKDLRNVCLVSKTLDGVARPYLYQGVIVKDADTMAYLLRTLDENQAIGQEIKQLVLEVPGSSKDEGYRKPNAAILESRPNFKKIRKIADRASDFDEYQRYVDWSQSTSGRRREIPKRPFEEWTWGNNCEVFHHMRFEILLRTKNLESLYFGMILPPKYWGTSGYDSFMDNVQSTLGSATHLRRWVRDRKPVVPFLVNLTQLQLLGDIRDDNEPFVAELLECFLGITSLRTIKCFHDDGRWNRVDPFGARFKETPSKQSRQTPPFLPFHQSSRHDPQISWLVDSMTDLLLLQMLIGNVKTSHASIFNEATADREKSQPSARFSRH